jgi:hypothetical protein
VPEVEAEEYEAREAARRASCSRRFYGHGGRAFSWCDPVKLEDQVCSLELAKRLKELGVKQFGTIFAWAPISNRGTSDDWDWQDGVVPNTFQADIEFVAAFTVAELGEMLPEMCHSGRDGIGWLCFQPGNPEPYFNGKTEADARAKMLIHLIENKLVKP